MIQGNRILLFITTMMAYFNFGIQNFKELKVQNSFLKETKKKNLIENEIFIS